MATKPLQLLTWNLYLGGDVARLIDRQGSAPIEQRMGELWKMVLSTRFPLRAQMMADHVLRLKPDVIALQEVFRWTRVSDFPGGESDEPGDFLERLQSALLERKLSYQVHRTWGFCYEQRAGTGPVIRMEDSLVILVRDGLPVTNPFGKQFRVNWKAPIGGREVEATRCYQYLDVLTEDGPVRVANTHLEAFFSSVQQAQTEELLGAITPHPGRLVALGDFNFKGPVPDRSAPPVPEESFDVHQAFVRSRFRDAWLESGTGRAFTATQEEDLRQEDNLTERIDWILGRGVDAMRNAELVGANRSDRREGLWPSDHAGVFARVHLG